jgi:hypothetical protein
MRPRQPHSLPDWPQATQASQLSQVAQGSAWQHAGASQHGSVQAGSQHPWSQTLWLKSPKACVSWSHRLTQAMATNSAETIVFIVVSFLDVISGLHVHESIANQHGRDIVEKDEHRLRFVDRLAKPADLSRAARQRCYGGPPRAVAGTGRETPADSRYNACFAALSPQARCDQEMRAGRNFALPFACCSNAEYQP